MGCQDGRSFRLLTIDMQSPLGLRLLLPDALQIEKVNNHDIDPVRLCLMRGNECLNHTRVWGCLDISFEDI